MWQEGRGKVNAPLTSWQDALNAPGTGQTRHLRTLMEARPLRGRMLDPQLVADTFARGQRIQAIRGQG